MDVVSTFNAEFNGFYLSRKCPDSRDYICSLVFVNENLILPKKKKKNAIGLKKCRCHKKLKKGPIHRISNAPIFEGFNFELYM